MNQYQDMNETKIKSIESFIIKIKIILTKINHSLLKKILAHETV